MSLDMILTLVLAGGALVLFATEALRIDLVALLLMAALMILGIVSPEEGFAGFANPATITVAAMFVLSAALVRTGGADLVADLLTRAAPKPGAATDAAAHPRGTIRVTLFLMVTVGVLSAFVNNTAAVALFLPVTLELARRTGTSPSKLLIPLSFASMFGGVCTLVGTSTNILASSIAERYGAAPFGMFEMLPLGLVFFAVGLGYMALPGLKLLPSRRPPGDLTRSFRLEAYLTDLRVLPGALTGATLAGAPLLRELDLVVLELVRESGERFPMPSPDKVLQEGDILRVRTDLERIERLIEGGRSLGIEPLEGADWRAEEVATDRLDLVEVILPPGSRLAGRSLEASRFRSVYGATALAIRHGGDLVRERLASRTLETGDALLLEVRQDHREALARSEDLIVLSRPTRPGGRSQAVSPRRLVVAAGLLAAAVVTAAVGLAPIVVTATAAAVMVIATGCLSLDEAYEAIDWKVIFLLAGVLALGSALETTGAAARVAAGLLSLAGPSGALGSLGPALLPMALVSLFYLLTTLLTEAMSNNATVALLAPVALSTAAALEVDPRAFLMAVTFAASASFMTPVGYQTNTMVYGPGQYRFFDFTRVGGPLNLLFWLLASWLIPQIWPLVPAG